MIAHVAHPDPGGQRERVAQQRWYRNVDVGHERSIAHIEGWKEVQIAGVWSEFQMGG